MSAFLEHCERTEVAFYFIAIKTYIGLCLRHDLCSKSDWNRTKQSKTRGCRDQSGNGKVCKT